MNTSNLLLLKDDSINRQYNVLATERSSLAVEAMMPQFLTNITNSLFGSSETAIEETTKSNKISSKSYLKQLRDFISGVKFTDIAHTNITVPDNFEGVLVDYLTLLSDSSIKHHSNVVKSLNMLDDIVSDVVNNRNHSNIFKKYRSFEPLLTEMGDMKDGFKEYFPTDKGKTIARLGDVVGNKDEITRLGELMDVKVPVSNLKTMVALNKRVKKVATSVNHLHGIIETDGLDGNIIRDIRKITYACAVLVEFMGVLAYDYRVITTTVNEITKLRVR